MVQVLTNLKTALVARGVRQADLAIWLEISPSMLSEIVCGRRQADSSLRARIAEKLRADEKWLFSTVTRIPAPASFGNRDAPQAAFACAGKET